MNTNHGRRRRAVGLFVASVMTCGSFLIFGATSAHSASIVSETNLYTVKDNPLTPKIDERNVAVSNPFDPSCTHVPGIVRGGKVWVDTYIRSDGSRYNGMKFNFYTTYRKATAVAKQSYIDQYGTQPSCAFLNTFDNKGELPSLRAMTCQNPWANHTVGLYPTRWCQLEARLDSGQQVPHTVDLQAQNCQQPQWNGGRWGGPAGWASWHNQNVYMTRTDIEEELGVGWIPGHFNIDTYIEDFDMLSGVSNLDPSTLQPSAGDGRWLGYGKVQTGTASELWVRFFDAVARAKGANPITNPILADDTIAPAAIALNEKLTINLWPDVPSKSAWITVNVGSYRNNLFQVICAFSPSVSSVLGDSNAGHLVFPLAAGPCDLGFSQWAPQSSAGNGQSFLEFVQANSPDDAKQLAGHQTQYAQIIQEAFNNRDTVNHLLIRSPLMTDPTTGKTILQCNVQQDLGVSRGTHYNADGSLNVDLPDQHFRRIFTH